MTTTARQARHQARAQEIEAKLKALTPGQQEIAMAQVWAACSFATKLGFGLSLSGILDNQEKALAYAATRSRG